MPLKTLKPLSLSMPVPQRHSRHQFSPTEGEDLSLLKDTTAVAVLPQCQTQRVHVGIWYILKAQRGSHIPTLGPKYLPYSYMDPLGKSTYIVQTLVSLVRTSLMVWVSLSYLGTSDPLGNFCGQAHYSIPTEKCYSTGIAVG